MSLPHPVGASPDPAAAESLCQLPREGPAALPGCVHPLPPCHPSPPWQAWPQPCATRSQRGERGLLIPLTEESWSQGQQRFSISESPRGKRSHVPWGHGWSSPLGGHRGNLDPLRWHCRCSEATHVPSHSIAALAGSYPKHSVDP